MGTVRSQNGFNAATDHASHVLLHANNAGVPATLNIDNASHGLICIDHAHHEIHDGNAFRYNDPITLASAATQDYLLTVADTTKWPHYTFSVDGTAITTVEVFEGSDRTGTTLQSVFNANRNSATTAGMTIHKGTSGGTTDGDSIFKYSSGTSSGSTKMEGVAAYDGERMLKQNTKYIIRITSGTNGNLINLRSEWYEHTSIA
jgi:hypothetical protein